MNNEKFYVYCPECKKLHESAKSDSLNIENKEPVTTIHEKDGLAYFMKYAQPVRFGDLPSDYDDMWEVFI